MDQATALVLLRSGQMPLARYIELARENGWLQMRARHRTRGGEMIEIKRLPSFEEAMAEIERLRAEKAELVALLKERGGKMSDIIERLRLTLRNCAEAAGEIERLRAEKAELLDALQQAVDDFGDNHCVCEDTKQQCIAAIARAEGK
jgi:hypothetical protein